MKLLDPMLPRGAGGVGAGGEGWELRQEDAANAKVFLSLSLSLSPFSLMGNVQCLLDTPLPPASSTRTTAVLLPCRSTQ